MPLLKNLFRRGVFLQILPASLTRQPAGTPAVYKRAPAISRGRLGEEKQGPKGLALDAIELHRAAGGHGRRVRASAAVNHGADRRTVSALHRARA